MKIGINITAFNRKRFTEHCFKSIIWYNPKNVEFVIVDNNSKDGTREIVKKYHNKYPKLFTKIFLNNKNMYLGYAINQGWKYLSNSCDILGTLDNDFLVEPGCYKNIISCFEELNIQFIIGTVRNNLKPLKTKSNNGIYTVTNGNGSAKLILSSIYKKGIKHSLNTPKNGNAGPSGGFYNKLIRNKYKGIRLYHPGIMVRDPEVNSIELYKYYNLFFKERGLLGRLNNFRKRDLNGNPIGWGNWNDFLKKWYPEKYEKEKE